MTVISVKADISGALAKLTAAASNQVPFATALALTKTAQLVKADLRQEMQNVFKSAVSFTLNSLYIKSATKSNLVSIVGVKSTGRTSAATWLRPEIEGGPRFSGIEAFLRPAGLPPPGLYAVPGSGAPLSSGGKINISALQRIVAQLTKITGGAQGFAALKRKRTGTRAQYFYLRSPQFGLPAGIFGLKGRQVSPIILFVRQPQYRKRFDFYGVGQSSARRRFPEQFEAAMQTAIKTAR